MSQYRVIRNERTGAVLVRRAKWCSSFLCHFVGLQLRPSLPRDEGLLFVLKRESISQSAIHMFFVFFRISVIWLDASGKVVDKKLAKPWRPVYAPQAPAQYYLEATPDLLNQVEIGDTLTFDEAAT